MRLSAALLAALLALPSSAFSQLRGVRAVVPRVATVTPVPTLNGAGLSPGAPALGAPLSPALAPTLTPTLAPAYDAPAPGPSAVSALDAAPSALGAATLAPAAAFVGAAPADAPRLPGSEELGGDGVLPGGLDAAARRAPTLRDWLRRYGTADPNESAAKLAAAFDGQRRLRADDGSHFEPVVHAAGVRFVRVGPAPASSEGRVVPGTEGLSGRALLEAVGRAAKHGHVQHEYEQASDYLFSQADNVTLGGVRGVVDAYSGVFIPGSSPDGRDYPEPGDRNHDGHVDEGMNVEHVWPQSRFAKRLPMRADLHHLMATFIHPNGVRANLPFGIVRHPTYHNDAGTKSDGSLFEPADFSKGRVARAMLYFYARYREQNIHQSGGPAWWDRQIGLLLDWNRRFPPDAGERRRNDLVERFQGNRNPFIDDPGLADRVGAEAFRPQPPRPRADRGRAQSRGFRRPSSFAGRRR